MSDAIRDALPAAITILISTAPILAIVLLLVTSRPARVSLMFLLGWATGIITVAGAIVAFVDTSVPKYESEGLSTPGAIVRILLGAALGLVALRAWRHRVGGDSPKWVSGLAGWSPFRALAIGFAAGSVSPKNLALVAVGAAAILDATAVPVEQAVAIVVFSAVASLGVAAPMVLRAVGGRAAAGALQGAAEWMTTNAKTISAVVLAILALVLVVTGVAGLSSARDIS